MKKLFAILLALAMVLSLCACTASPDEETLAEIEDIAARVEALEAGLAEDAGEAEEAEEAPAEEAVSYPEMELNVAISYNESENIGQLFQRFMDYVTERSGGAITFNVYWGGTFASSTEELDYVANGSVDMTLLSLAQYTSVLPLSNFPAMAGESQENVVSMVEYVMFENEETASLIEEELTNANIKFFGMAGGGTNAIASKTPLANYEDCSGKILGAMMNQSTYEDLGMTFKFSLPPETYSDLQKGVIDCAGLSLAGVVSLAWYEVAPYVITDGMYSCSNFFTMNLDKWNSLDADTQALLKQCADDTRQYNFDLLEEEYEYCVETINNYNAEHGIDATVGEQDAEHAQIQLETYMKNAFADCRVCAENAGVSEQMEVILTAVADTLGITVE